MLGGFWMVWGKARDTSQQGGHLSWCANSKASIDCGFYIKKTGYCTERDCEYCTVCGIELGHHGRNRHKAHLYRAKAHGGKTWVPTCMNCNQSRGITGFKKWLRELPQKNPKLYEKIVRYQNSRWWKHDFIRNTVEQIDREIYAKSRR